MPRVSVGVLIRGGRVLLCHRVVEKVHDPDRWDFPGGHVEPGESDGEALARELEEEVGVVVEPPSRPCDLEVRRGSERPPQSAAERACGVHRSHIRVAQRWRFERASLTVSHCRTPVQVRAFDTPRPRVTDL
ncbi:MAG TPA: NUDIX domain-containing protein [Amnibacterium sp.]|jgi:8-oxo-dGTP pyrophosphatase MutT (NUDIX family)|uniref:NUDIX hydrolase n=1 Tax=Amnibacterium sp. TaxID=1872496 RepID=UPI002F945018